MMRALAVLAFLASAAPALAQDVVTRTFDGTFKDAAFAVETAITNKGLVVDYVSHVGEMLSRTASDVGSDVEIFTEADVFLFCSAVVSRAVMEADPMNVAFCPYSIFVAEREGEVTIGYRKYPDGAMQQAQKLLEEIVADAAM